MKILVNSQNKAYLTSGSKALIPTGIDLAEEKDICFWDYDGTLVESWTLEELQTKTALPPNPTHTGLTAQGWNWTLADLKADNGMTDVGQNYITDDGKTRFYLHFSSYLPTESRDIWLNLAQNVANGVTIDWGDGSATETYNSTGSFTKTHSYSTGDYVLTLSPTDNCSLTLDVDCIQSWDTKTSLGCINVQHIEVGKNTIFRATSIRYLPNVKTISCPNNIDFSSQGLAMLLSLKCFVYPPSATVSSFGGGGYLGGLFSLKALCIPKAMVTFGWYQFNGSTSASRMNTRNIVNLNSRSMQGLINVKFFDLSSVVGSIGYVTGFTFLEKIIFGSGITGFVDTIMNDCKRLREVHFKGATPPTLANANAFKNTPTTCKFYVPTGCLEAYTTATNYPDPTVYTYVEE